MNQHGGGVNLRKKIATKTTRLQDFISKNIDKQCYDYIQQQWLRKVI